jgi:hypothetical protein
MGPTEAIAAPLTLVRPGSVNLPTLRCMQRYASALFASVGVACMLGCATPDPSSLPARPALKVEIGPEFVLTDRPPRGLAAAQAADGRLHVFALMAEDKDLQHVVVGSEGVESRETVLKGVEIETAVLAVPSPYNNLAAGFDADGTLRVVFREQHLSLQDGRWSEPAKGPPCEQLIRTGAALQCLYRETGGAHGAPMRLQWYIVPPSPVPIPIPQRNTKLLLACRSPAEWITWAIFEPDAGRDVTDFRAAADQAGALQVVYTGQSPIPLGTAVVMAARTPMLPSCDADLAGKPVIGVAGLRSGFGIDRNFDGRIAIATDPGSQDSLILFTTDYGAISFMLVDGAITNKVLDVWKRNPLIEDFWGVALKAAGGGNFHAMYTTNRATSHYLIYASGVWSEPVQLFTTRSTFLIAEAPDRVLVAGMAADKKSLVSKRLRVLP